MMEEPAKWYYAHRDEVNWLRNPTNAARPLRYDRSNRQTIWQNTVGRLGSRIINDPTDFFGADTSYQQAEVGGYTVQNDGSGSDLNIPAGQIVDGQAVTVQRAATYVDQMMPFDITLVAQNEYGQAAWSSINAVEIINEGLGISVD